MERHYRTRFVLALLLTCFSLAGCKSLLKVADNGPGYLPGGPLKIAYRLDRQQADGSATHCFDISNPTRRPIREITIGTGWNGIAWRSGENLSGRRTSGQMQYWQPSITPNSSPKHQLITIKRISGERARDASRESHIGEVCYEASSWVMAESRDFSKLRHTVQYD